MLAFLIRFLQKYTNVPDDGVGVDPSESFIITVKGNVFQYGLNGQQRKMKCRTNMECKGRERKGKGRERDWNGNCEEKTDLFCFQMKVWMEPTSESSSSWS